MSGCFIQFIQYKRCVYIDSIISNSYIIGKPGTFIIFNRNREHIPFDFQGNGTCFFRMINMNNLLFEFGSQKAGKYGHLDLFVGNLAGTYNFLNSGIYDVIFICINNSSIAFVIIRHIKRSNLTASVIIRGINDSSVIERSIFD